MRKGQEASRQEKDKEQSANGLVINLPPAQQRSEKRERGGGLRSSSAESNSPWSGPALDLTPALAPEGPQRSLEEEKGHATSSLVLSAQSCPALLSREREGEMLSKLGTEASWRRRTDPLVPTAGCQEMECSGCSPPTSTTTQLNCDNPHRRESRGSRWRKRHGLAGNWAGSGIA
jgi:hypothetical protein